MHHIEFLNIKKQYGSCVANEDVSFKIKKGTIHGIVGENGAGKSTAMKILFGIDRPTSGKIKILGQEVDFRSPHDAKSFKIGMVHQHFMLAEGMLAIDHIILESFKKNHGLFKKLNRVAVIQELNQICQKLKFSIPWLEYISNIPVGIQQQIEIIKLLYNESEILILDEPTAVLSKQEIDDFLKMLKDLKQQGKTILLITHKLKEVFACCDEVTVFRKGKVIQSQPIENWTIETLAESLVGHRIETLKNIERPAQFKSQKTLEINHLFGRSYLQIEKGEILGVAGVEGNGQSDLIKAVVDPKSYSKINSNFNLKFESQSVNNLNNQSMRDLGLAYIPEDRHHQAVVLNANLLENFLLGKQKMFSILGWIQKSKLVKFVNERLHFFDVRFNSLEQKMSDLSGGNQQKFVVARELTKSPASSHPVKLLIACQPTRGVDILSIHHIHTQILNLKKEGCATLLISSELDELLKLSDRIIVIYRNEIISEFERSQFNEEKIGAAMGGVVL
jgi:ABC-type uncharacterized transport system ATPase subunit